MNELFEINGEYKRLEFVEELQARYDARQSFYKKANIYKDKNNIYYLCSYNTIVSQCKNGIIEHFGKWSQTTTRHQKEFEKQYKKEV